MRVRFSIEGSETEVEVLDAALAPRVAALFPHGRIEEETGRASESDVGEGTAVTEVSVGPDGYVFGTREGRTTYTSLPGLLAAVELALATDLLARDRGSTHLHAAAAVTPKGAIVATGPSGAGKSSLALAWSLAGHPLLGDDVVRIDENGRLRTFPRLLKVRPDLVTEYGLDLERTPAWAPGSEEAWFDPTTAGGWAGSGSRATVLARIEYGAADDVQVRALEAAEGLHILLGAVHTTGLRKEQSVDRLISLLEGVRVFDVRFGSSVRAARVLEEIGEEMGHAAVGPLSPAPTRGGLGA